jgi:hypothetical protein
MHKVGPIKSLGRFLLEITRATRERILSGLKLGKQAPGYEAAFKALDRFIDELYKLL